MKEVVKYLFWFILILGGSIIIFGCGYAIGVKHCGEVIKNEIRIQGSIEIGNEILYGQVKKKPSIMPY
jgi:hypothetical protein